MSSSTTISDYRRRIDIFIGSSNAMQKADRVLAAAYRDKNVSVEQYKNLRQYALSKLTQEV